MDHTSLKVTQVRLSVFQLFLGLPPFRPVGKRRSPQRAKSLVDLTNGHKRIAMGSPRHSL